MDWKNDTETNRQERNKEKERPGMQPASQGENDKQSGVPACVGISEDSLLQ